MIGEMKRRVESKDGGNFLDRFGGVEKEIACALEADVELILLGSGICTGLKKVPEAGISDMHFAGELLHVEGLAGVFKDVHHRALNKRVALAFAFVIRAADQ